MRLNRFLKQAFFKNALLFAFYENRTISSLRGDKVAVATHKKVALSFK